MFAWSRVAHVLVPACAALLLGACTESPPPRSDADAIFEAAMSYPSSAAYDARQKSLLIGSYDDGAVQRVAIAPANGRTKASALPQDDRKHVLRIRIDAERQRIWVLDAAGLFAYDAASSRLIRRWSLDDTQHSNQHCLPDMAVHPSGTVFISSAIQPKLWRIDGATLEASAREIAVNADQGKDFGFSALTFAGDDNTLYAGSAMTGALWKVDFARATATKLNLPEPIIGACALHATRDAAQPQAPWSLYVAGGFRDGAMRVQLSRDGQPDSITPVKRALRAVAPVNFVKTERDLLLVSSHLSDHPEFNGLGRSAKGLKLVSLMTR